MVNLLDLLIWNFSSDIRKKAKLEVFKYNTFRQEAFYGEEKAYQFVDAPELTGEPLNIKDPKNLAAIASIIAEMEGHSEIAFRKPIVMLGDKQTVLEKIAREERIAIERASNYHGLNQDSLSGMLNRLKQRNDPDYGKDK